jgi:hypothetical protein
MRRVRYMRCRAASMAALLPPGGFGELNAALGLPARDHALEVIRAKGRPATVG